MRLPNLILGWLLIAALPIPAASAADLQGVAGLTAQEASALAALRLGKSDPAKVADKILRDAAAALKVEPQPFAALVTSGDVVKSGGKSNSHAADEEARATWSLALAYAMTGAAPYLDQARHYLLRWAEVNQPSGDAVAATKFVPMFHAYDTLRPQFTAEERTAVDRWLRAMADAVMADQEEARQKHVPRGVNNHRTHALLVIGTIGCVLGEPKYIHYVTDRSGYLSHIGENLRSYEGEPPGFGYDYHQRKAVHYVAYNMQAFGRLAVLLDRLRQRDGQEYGINYNPYTVEVDGASLLKTFRSFLPYAAGETQSTQEFEGTLDAHDLDRLANGSLNRNFNRRDAVPALEAAAYFFPRIVYLGKTYNLSGMVADIVSKDKGRLSLPESIPTPQLLINSVQSNASR